MNPYMPPNQGYYMGNIQPPQQFAVHHIRNSHSWKDLIDEANDWVNTNIHVKRVISISTTLCHTTSQGMVTIYYDKSQGQHMQQLVSQFGNFGLFYEILETTDKWDEQRKNTMVLIKHLCQNQNRLIAVNQLQQNQQYHESALTIIWYMRKH